MYASDRNYLSRFALDSSMEYGCEDLYGRDLSYDFSYDEEIDPFANENIPEAKDLDLEDDFLF